MINNYLISILLLVIDEFNETYRHINLMDDKDKEELRRIADFDYTEADIVIKIGYPFRNMAHFNMQSKSNDIIIKSKDFILEVKYLCRQKSKIKNKDIISMKNKTIWGDAFQKDYNWLCEEIKRGNKGKRAFLLSWFNAYDSFGSIMQLGDVSGPNPKINNERKNYFKFLNNTGECIDSLFYQYTNAYKVFTINIEGYEKEIVECMFFCQKDDKFHFALYW